MLVSMPFLFCRRAVGSIMVLRRIFWPLSSLLIRSGIIAEKVVQKENRALSVDDLEQALELTDEDDLKDEKNMLEGIVRFGDETAKEVMTSRQDVVDLDFSLPFPEVLKCIVENNYSRIPVYQNTIDNIRGILYIKDLLPHISSQQLFVGSHLYVHHILCLKQRKSMICFVSSRPIKFILPLW